LVINYWDRRYSRGGSSGAGSVGKLREWKWERIIYYAKNIDDVIDVGCGDRSFWYGRSCKNYIGIDSSKVIIDKLKKRKDGQYIYAEELPDLPPVRIVLCLDVLFHVMDDGLYERMIQKLKEYSNEWIFIYTWLEDPLEKPSSHQVYRPLDLGLEPIIEQNKYDPYGALFVFRV